MKTTLLAIILSSILHPTDRALKLNEQIPLEYYFAPSREFSEDYNESSLSSRPDFIYLTEKDRLPLPSLTIELPK